MRAANLTTRTAGDHQAESDRPAPADAAVAVAVARLAIGSVSLGTEEVVRRFRAIPKRIEPRGEQPTTEHRAVSLPDLGAGLVVESAVAASRLLGAAAGGGRLATAGVSRVVRVPAVQAMIRPLRRPYRRYEGAVRRLCEIGHAEELAGRDMVQGLIRDTTSKSITDITQFAVKEVAQSPEMKALVRSQSAGIATERILEVRASTQKADGSVERRVRSWLHLHERNGASKRRTRRKHV
jgi:hypothetical protein